MVLPNKYGLLVQNTVLQIFRNLLQRRQLEDNVENDLLQYLADKKARESY